MRLHRFFEHESCRVPGGYRDGPQLHSKEGWAEDFTIASLRHLILRKTYFYIKAEIDDELALGLGFDTEEMQKIKQEGFDILLLPRNSPGQNSEYLGEYEKIIRDFGIKYIIFDGHTVAGFPDNLNSVKDIILENNIIF